jgi:hypothetical protein
LDLELGTRRRMEFGQQAWARSFVARLRTASPVAIEQFLAEVYSRSH